MNCWVRWSARLFVLCVWGWAVFALGSVETTQTQGLMRVDRVVVFGRSDLVPPVTLDWSVVKDSDGMKTLFGGFWAAMQTHVKHSLSGVGVGQAARPKEETADADGDGEPLIDVQESRTLVEGLCALFGVSRSDCGLPTGGMPEWGVRGRTFFEQAHRMLGATRPFPVGRTVTIPMSQVVTRPFKGVRPLLLDRGRVLATFETVTFVAFPEWRQFLEDVTLAIPRGFVDERTNPAIDHFEKTMEGLLVYNHVMTGRNERMYGLFLEQSGRYRFAVPGQPRLGAATGVRALARLFDQTVDVSLTFSSPVTTIDWVIEDTEAKPIESAFAQTAEPRLKVSYEMCQPVVVSIRTHKGLLKQRLDRMFDGDQVWYPGYPFHYHPTKNEPGRKLNLDYHQCMGQFAPELAGEFRQALESQLDRFEGVSQTVNVCGRVAVDSQLELSHQGLVRKDKTSTAEATTVQWEQAAKRVIKKRALDVDQGMSTLFRFGTLLFGASDVETHMLKNKRWSRLTGREVVGLSDLLLKQVALDFRFLPMAMTVDLSADVFDVSVIGRDGAGCDGVDFDPAIVWRRKDVTVTRAGRQVLDHDMDVLTVPEQSRLWELDRQSLTRLSFGHLRFSRNTNMPVERLVAYIKRDPTTWTLIGLRDVLLAMSDARGEAAFERAVKEDRALDSDRIDTIVRRVVAINPRELSLGSDLCISPGPATDRVRNSFSDTLVSLKQSLEAVSVLKTPVTPSPVVVVPSPVTPKPPLPKPIRRTRPVVVTPPVVVPTPVVPKPVSGPPTSSVTKPVTALPPAPAPSLLPTVKSLVLRLREISSALGEVRVQVQDVGFKQWLVQDPTRAKAVIDPLMDWPRLVPAFDAIKQQVCQKTQCSMDPRPIVLIAVLDCLDQFDRETLAPRPDTQVAAHQRESFELAKQFLATFKDTQQNLEDTYRALGGR